MKFVVWGFIELLCEELDIEWSCVSVICVYSGGVKINIVCNSWMGDMGNIVSGSKEEIMEFFDCIVWFMLE